MERLIWKKFVSELQYRLILIESRLVNKSEDRKLVINSCKRIISIGNL